MLEHSYNVACLTSSVRVFSAVCLAVCKGLGLPLGSLASRQHFEVVQAVNFQPIEIDPSEVVDEVSMKEFTALKGLQILAVNFPISDGHIRKVDNLALDAEFKGDLSLTVSGLTIPFFEDWDWRLRAD